MPLMESSLFDQVFDVALLGRTSEEYLVLENAQLKLKFSSKTGLLQSVTKKETNKTQKVYL